MTHIFDKDRFTAKYITGRVSSAFEQDLNKSKEQISEVVAGNRILVIGGAGSIGSAFIKALLPYAPSSVVVFDISENDLAELVRDLRSSHHLPIPKDFRTYAVNFGSTVFKRFLEEEKPFSLVANFAAHKHVRSEKDYYSLQAMLENNVLFNINLLEWLKSSSTSRFFCVSSDKAANPGNAMGASKRLMEKVLMNYSEDIQVTSARFANVAFSKGSLLDSFLNRLNKGQPLTAPLDVKRYFISYQEAADLCLLASCCGKSGDIFFPAFGREELFSFSQIAIYLLQECGFEAYICADEEEARNMSANRTGNLYPVVLFKSDTSGEKPEEEFYTEKEMPDFDLFSNIGVITGVSECVLDKKDIQSQLGAIFAQKKPTKNSVILTLKKLLPEFSHVETGKNLDEKM